MARIKIELDMPEDRGELITYLNGMKWLVSIQELDDWLRAEEKHGDHTEEVFDWIDKTRERLRDIMDGLNVSMRDLD